MTDILLDWFDRFPAWDTSEGARGFVSWMTQADVVGCYPTPADLDGMVVGVETRHRRPLMVAGQEFLISRGPYAGMHSVARGRGWFRALREYRRDEADGGVGFSQVAATMHVRRIGESRTPANPWTVFARIFHPWQAARRSGALVRPLAAAGYASLALRGRLAMRSYDAEVELRHVEQFDERVDVLSDNAREEFDFYLARRAPFLNWRYCDPRGGYYRVVLAERGDELLGYIVYVVSDLRAKIVDLLSSPGRLEVVRALLAAALASCRQAGVDGVEYWNMAHHPYAAALREFGFVRMARRTQETSRRVNFRGRNPALFEALTPIVSKTHARIHLTAGDSELC